MKRTAIIVLSIMMICMELMPAYADTVDAVETKEEQIFDDTSADSNETVDEGEIEETDTNEENLENEDSDEMELEKDDDTDLEWYPSEELADESSEEDDLVEADTVEENRAEDEIPGEFPADDELDGEMINADSAAKYNPGAALEYARNHWDDGKGLCSEFVSRCINQGGCSAYSISCTSLRSQLISSGMGTEYEIKLSAGQTINMNNYSGKISAGDVVFYYCPTCVYADQKPYIHSVLCNGADSSGFMKAFSHNNANSGSSRYSYRTTCYAHTGTAINKAYVYHFNSNSLPKGVLDGVTGEYGRIFVDGWAFDPDATSASVRTIVYVGGPEGSSSAERIDIGLANTRRDDVNAVYGCGNYHGFSTWLTTSKRGNQTVYVYALDSTSGSTLIGSRTVNVLAPVTVNSDASSISEQIGETKELGISVNGDGIAKLVCIIGNGNIAKVEFKDMNWNTGKGHLNITGLNCGTTTLSINAYDTNENVLQTRRVDISVTAPGLKYNVSNASIEEQQSATVKISWDNFTGTIAPRLTTDGVAGLSWGSIDKNNRTAELILIGEKAGTTELVTELKDSNGVVLTRKSIPVKVTEKPVSYSLDVNTSSITLEVGESAEFIAKYSTEKISDVEVAVANSSISSSQVVSKNLSKGTAAFRLTGKQPGSTLARVKLYKSNGNLALSKFVYIKVNQPKADPDPAADDSETEEPGTDNPETNEEGSEIEEDAYFELDCDSIRTVVGRSEVIDVYFDSSEVKDIKIDSEYSFFEANVDADFDEGEAVITVKAEKRGTGEFTITAYDITGEILAEEQVSVYIGAKREGKTYTIKYKCEKNAEFDSNPEQYCPIEIDEDLELADATRPGYVFKGWYDRVGRRVSAITSNDYGNIVLFAKWKPIRYIINFDAGVSGSEQVNVSTKTVNAKYGHSYFLRRRFKRTGYKLIGWSTTRGGSPEYKVGQRVKNLCDLNNQEITFYAVWEIKEDNYNLFRNLMR